MDRQCRQLILAVTFALWVPDVHAGVPEGLEGLLLGGKAGARAYLAYKNTENLWRTEGSSGSFIVDYVNAAKNSFTLGYYQTANQTFDRPDKFAYFLRFDYTMGGTQSVSLKYLHNDWSYIPAAQENWSFEYNGFFSVQSLGTGAYYSLGIYRRWLKQSWNDDYQNPLSYQSDDVSAFAAATLGIMFKMGSDTLTFDLNNRDTFNFFNSDDVATDLTYYWQLANGKYLRFLVGARWSGFFTFLPGYAATNYLGMAYSW
jgi:hypothetical protein